MALENLKSVFGLIQPTKNTDVTKYKGTRDDINTPFSTAALHKASDFTPLTDNDILDSMAKTDVTTIQGKPVVTGYHKTNLTNFNSRKDNIYTILVIFF